jgi:alkaline phosphatase D
VCARPILGVYDDHDFGWNNGNRRLPHKDVYKNMYLDAIGEPQGSPRRGALRGAWAKYTLNAGLDRSISVDVFLLDERYNRDPLPCETRWDYCTLVVFPDTTDRYTHDRPFCNDFVAGGPTNKGSCCDKDEKIFFGWCRLSASTDHPLWREACDVTYDLFAHRSLVLDPVTGDLGVASESGTRFNSGVRDVDQATHFCDVLGREQVGGGYRYRHYYCLTVLRSC